MQVHPVNDAAISGERRGAVTSLLDCRFQEFREGRGQFAIVDENLTRDVSYSYFLGEEPTQPGAKWWRFLEKLRREPKLANSRDIEERAIDSHCESDG